VFTGIVRERGRVLVAEQNGGGVRLRIAAPETAEATSLGDSIAISGVCLTTVAVQDGELAFDAVPETPHDTCRSRCGRRGQPRAGPESR